MNEEFDRTPSCVHHSISRGARACDSIPGRFSLDVIGVVALVVPASGVRLSRRDPLSLARARVRSVRWSLERSGTSTHRLAIKYS